MPPVSDTSIEDWKADYTGLDTNGPADSDLTASLVDDQIRNIRSVVRAESTNKEWIKLSVMPTYVSATSFSVPGDLRLEFAVGRRVKATLSGSTKYGTILSRNFSGGETQVTMEWDPEQIGVFGTSAIFVSPNEFRVDGNTEAYMAAGAPLLLDAPDGSYRCVGLAFGADYDAIDNSTYCEITAGDPFVPIPATANADAIAVVARSLGIDNTVSAVELGLFTPALFQSGWPLTIASGSFQITADNTAGPFSVTLPYQQPDPDYLVHVQPTGANTTPSANAWAFPDVTSRSNTAFQVTFSAAVNTGPVLSYDFWIARGQ